MILIVAEMHAIKAMNASGGMGISGGTGSAYDEWCNIFSNMTDKVLEEQDDSVSENLDGLPPLQALDRRLAYWDVCKSRGLRHEDIPLEGDFTSMQQPQEEPPVPVASSSEVPRPSGPPAVVPPKKQQALMQRAAAPQTPTLSLDDDQESVESDPRSVKRKTGFKKAGLDWNPELDQKDWPSNSIEVLRTLPRLIKPFNRFRQKPNAENLVKLLRIIYETSKSSKKSSNTTEHKFFCTKSGKFDKDKVVELLIALKNAGYDINVFDDVFDKETGTTVKMNALRLCFVRYIEMFSPIVRAMVDAGISTDGLTHEWLSKQLELATNTKTQTALKYLIKKLPAKRQADVKQVPQVTLEDEEDDVQEIECPAQTVVLPGVAVEPQPEQQPAVPGLTMAAAAAAPVIKPQLNLFEIFLKMKSDISWNVFLDSCSKNPTLRQKFNTFKQSPTTANLVYLADEISHEKFPRDMPNERVIDIGVKLLSDTNQNLNIKDAQGRNALQVCIENGIPNLCAVQMLIEAGVDFKVYNINTLDLAKKRYLTRSDVNSEIKKRMLTIFRYIEDRLIFSK